MSRLFENFRSPVSSLDAFRSWVRGATYGDWCIYHVGNLSADRAASIELNRLAEMAMLLAELGIINSTQSRLNLAAGAQQIYQATRTMQRHPPRALVMGEISATDYRALQALSTRQASVSVTRTIRDAACVSERTAMDIADRFKAEALLEPQEPKGWKITDRALEVLR